MADKRYGLVYDSNKCIGCQSCSVACRAENKVPDGVSRLQVWIEGPKGRFPNLVMDFHRQSCVMCDNAPCVSVCPTGASYTNKDGVNLVDEKKCVGCKYCVTACPYQARFINPKTGAADKCTFCYTNRTAKGQKPACVAVCPTGALTFGDLNDPQSEVRAALSKNYIVKPKQHLGTRPKVTTIPNWRGGEA
ncbi:4Fe-4S dicluster domain-containing protein [Sporolituus thermophilus]|uniref:Polysulfide reductase chain B n=1 Tax=Sporolituus thermophilus DSM 23256 TaxID=1123285 RepID=A0A1G7N2K7_9FIRM|nr:4Fe-4S dicluster domain-containing protein [Sporolituus thermophilus]SDF68254.1 polysulfide reductase chain B [Sporolituus thermophilus DSM 23256]